MRINMSLREIAAIFLMLSIAALLFLVTEGPPIGPAFLLFWVAFIMITTIQRTREKARIADLVDQMILECRLVGEVREGWE